MYDKRVAVVIVLAIGLITILLATGWLLGGEDDPGPLPTVTPTWTLP